MKQILVPTDFSFLANCAVNLATRFAIEDKASVTLLHVIEPPVSKMNSTGEIIKDAMGDIYIIQLMEKSKKQLQEIVDMYSDRQVQMSYAVVIGEPSLSILDEILSRKSIWL